MDPASGFALRRGRLPGIHEPRKKNGQAESLRLAVLSDCDPSQKMIFVPIWMFLGRLFWLFTLPKSALVGDRFGLLKNTSLNAL